MTSDQTQYLIKALIEKGVAFEKGLREDEIEYIQKKFEIVFPPDLKMFLHVALPVSKGFVNWRSALSSSDVSGNIFHRMEGPLDGILFDVKHNVFWFDEWGIAPDTNEEKEKIVREQFKTYPKLIPVCYHRFISSEPNEMNNPIISVHQTDIIYYGHNLADYFKHEFHFNLLDDFYIPSEPKAIRFWVDMMN